MKRYLISTLIIFLIILGFSTKSKVAALDDFVADYDINYKIEPNGETFVTQNITITNLKNDSIATSYTLSIKQLGIYDVSGNDLSDDIEPNVSEADGTTKISAKFNDFIIGEGRQNKITLKYKTKDIATKIGRIWNINIPQTRVPESTSIYNISVNIPAEFGPKNFISPTPVIEETEEKTLTIRYTKEALKDTSISASFGHYQLLNYELTYQLENPNMYSATYEIALPSDIAHYQQVKYDNISPLPKKMGFDGDSNLIASYALGSKQKIEVVVKGSARISGRQINPDSGGKFEDIPNELKVYTKPQKFWESESKGIVSIAQSLLKSDQNVSQNAQNLYKYITQNYHYDFDIVNQNYIDRKGAEQSLIRQNSLGCMEFTDLFIAIARAMNIPTREINGIALSDTESLKPLSIKFNGADALHAWVEFYDPNFGWVQVDPTWGNTSGADYFTKLDTNHFEFVRKGLSSESPIPAGAYRFSESKKLVQVDFSQSDKEVEFDLQPQLKNTFNLNILELIKGNKRYILQNKGNVTFYANDNIKIAPSMSHIVYLNKNLQTIEIKDYNGTSQQKFIYEILTK